MIESSNSQFCLPFEHLNLRFNPFGELPLDQRHLFAVVPVDYYAERLGDDRSAIQFLGEKGRGKTTHLLAISERFHSSHYVRVPEEGRVRIPIASLLIVDEIQRLSPWQRGLVFRRRVPLVIGTHRDFARQMKRAGRDVCSVVVGALTDVKRLTLIFEKRIEYARRNEGPVPQIPQSSVERLQLRYGNDIRSMEGHLYKLFQELREPGYVEV